MTEEHWEEIDEVAGDLQAEILRGLLEAQGIKVFLSQEGGGHSVYALTVGVMGTVHILVPASQSQAAQAILQEYYSGKLEGTQFQEPEEENPEEDEHKE